MFGGTYGITLFYCEQSEGVKLLNAHGFYRTLSIHRGPKMKIIFFIILPIQSPFQILGRDIKVVVGVIVGSVCIAGAAVVVQELAVLVFVRVLACTQEQHVLQKMGLQKKFHN